jgi:Domain of unknown function (DUF6487)
MARKDPSCPQCRVPMERGFLLDKGHANAGNVAKWVEGEPVKSVLTGLKTKGRKVRTVVSFRCPDCGLLLDYANEVTSASAWART